MRVCAGYIEELILDSALSKNVLIWIANQEIPMMREAKTFLWFYYNTRGKEIDNILRLDDKYTAIEIKYQNEVSSRDIWRAPQVRDCAILTKEDLRTEGNVVLAPVDLTLAILKKPHQTL